MNKLRFAALAVLTVSGCASNPPPQDLPPVHPSSATAYPQALGGDFTALFGDQIEALWRTPREEYQALTARPEAQSRELRFSLDRQTFEYVEDGSVLVSGPIASGKAATPTPTGRFSVLSKDKDKESSRYQNEIGTQAWMPYSIQFYGNYFIHEGWLPGRPASHGCIRLGHHHAKLLFERMQIGDTVIVAR